MTPQLHEMVLRVSRPADEVELRRLALLDSTRPLHGDALVAEVEGRVVAALGLDDPRVVADPFLRTADAVELLQARADRLALPPEPPRRAWRLFRRPGHAAA